MSMVAEDNYLQIRNTGMQSEYITKTMQVLAIVDISIFWWVSYKF